MPTWSEILHELNSTSPPGQPPRFDPVRRKYLDAYSRLVGRPAIVYASGWTTGLASPNASITEDDLVGFMEVSFGIKGDAIDLFLHSPGGSVEAAEAIVLYLRKRFNHIRAIVPHVAMSAATMIACACDQIVMGKHSFLGPIDPQFELFTPVGPRMVAAKVILQQFQMAKKAIKDEPETAAAWYPMLSQYGPDVLQLCQNSIDRSRDVVTKWLSQWMFRDGDDVGSAAKIANFLAEHEEHLSHGRHLDRPTIEELGMKVERLEADQSIQDATLSVFHCYMHTFGGTGCSKIIENHDGRAYIKRN